MDDTPRPPLSLHGNIDVSLKVSDLLDPLNGNWDVTRLQTTFVNQDVDRILKIKCSPSLQDSYLWAFSKTGLYSSQSGYRLLESLPDLQTIPPPALSPIEKNLWSELWKIKTLPKIRHFMWKVLVGALAVTEKLRSRGIQANPLCSSCRSEP